MKQSHTLIHAIIDEIETVVIGKRAKIELAMAVFLSAGHLLINRKRGQVTNINSIPGTFVTHD
ncbi:MAG: hypothetical protein MUP09_08075 [Thiovulaceae bacterium]|nr:hypothetical protein [Sulfurimonadaceae bacterium]